MLSIGGTEVNFNVPIFFLLVCAVRNSSEPNDSDLSA